VRVVRACVRACVCVRVRACVCVRLRVCVGINLRLLRHFLYFFVVE
jgi:hypothetical protein